MQLILTSKEVEALYSFYRSQPKSVWADVRTNIVIKYEPNNIGNFVYVQTQEDLYKGKDNWQDITDYEAW